MESRPRERRRRTEILAPPRARGIVSAGKGVDRFERLVKKVNQLSKGVKPYYLGDFTTFTTFGGDYLARNLTLLSTWQNIFGTAADDLEGNKLTHQSLKLQFYMDLFSEDDGCDFTVMIMRAKKAGSQAVNTVTGGLSLVANSDYYMTKGMCIVNPDKYVVYKQKRITLTRSGISQVAIADQTQGGTNYYFSKTMKINRSYLNPAGNAVALTCPPNALDNLFLVIFNNNSVVDTENPAYAINVVHKVIVS